MKKFVSIGEAAKALGVSPQTLRRWDASGRLRPDVVSAGGRRRYDLYAIRPDLREAEPTPKRRTLAYARVSSAGQKPDLTRQVEILQTYCAAKGWTCDVLTDVGSGLNYAKPGLDRLLTAVMAGEAERVVITHKDRLLRFGAELVFRVCEAKGTEVVILNAGEDVAASETLARDVLEVLTVFSARLHGARSHRNRRLLDDLRKTAESAGG